MFIESFNDALLQKLKEKLLYQQYKVAEYGVFKQITAVTAFGREEQRTKANIQTYLLTKKIIQEQPDWIIHSPLYHFMKLCAEMVCVELKNKTIGDTITMFQAYLNQQFSEELRENISQENIVFVLQQCSFLNEENANTKVKCYDYVLESLARRIVEKYVCKYFNFKPVYQHGSIPLECIIYDIQKYNIVFVKKSTPNQKFLGTLEQPIIVSSCKDKKETILKFSETIITTNEVKFSIESKNKVTSIQRKIWEPFLPHSLFVKIDLDTYHGNDDFIVTFSENIQEHNIVYLKNDAEFRAVIIWCHNKMCCTK